jgi:4-hydroxy-tetrahydrodipicolinate synthase
LIQYLLNGGVHGIFAIGTTGEFYALSEEEYRDVLVLTKEEVKGRVPVYAGANHITTRGSIRLAQIAEDVGVDALSVLTPMFISPNQEQLVKHYTEIAKSTKLPIILYNNLPKTGVTITAPTAMKLADIPNIVGIKDSTGDMTLTAEYIRLTRGKNFHVMIGRDTLIHACLCYGGTGAVAACANVAPRIVADISISLWREIGKVL